MLIRRLPKALRTAIFVLGLTMITVASAIQEIETWNQADSATECASTAAAGALLSLFRS